MNSEIKARPWPVVLGAVAALLALAAGCADHGPTNLYSQPLFGETQSGAKLEVVSVIQDSLSPTTGLDGFVVTLKNNGNGSCIGPIHATLATSLSSCASPVSYGAPVATAVFGTQGQVIGPGDKVKGQAVDNFGTVQNSQYAFEVAFMLSSCAGTSVDFSVTAVDAHGSSWTSNFSALAQ